MAVKHHKLHSKFSCFQTPLIDFLCLGGCGGGGGRDAQIYMEERRSWE